MKSSSCLCVVVVKRVFCSQGGSRGCHNESRRARGSAMAGWIGFVVRWGGPPRRARGKLSKRTARIRAGGASTSPGAPGSNDQQPIMSDRCCVASCAPERQAGPASEDSCSKFQMLNAKCSVLSALHPRYPRRSFTRCAPGNNIATILDQELTVSRFRRKNCFPGLRGGLILGSLRLKYWTAHFGCARKNRSPAACVIV